MSDGMSHLLCGQAVNSNQVIKLQVLMTFLLAFSWPRCYIDYGAVDQVLERTLCPLQTVVEKTTERSTEVE